MNYVFDVDGVLCDIGEPINEEFKLWFLNYISDKRYYLVTGSDKEKTIQQVGQEIFDNASISFNCLGNSIWINGRETKINSFTLTASELSFIEDIISNSKYPHKFGRYIEYRQGSINFSTIGRNASVEDRKKYYEWDLFHGERNKIIKMVASKMPRFDVYKGGMISLDMCLNGANKSQCYELILEDSKINDMTFFADRTYQGGIDQPLSDVIKHFNGRVFDIRNGYKQTWNILKTL